MKKSIYLLIILFFTVFYSEVLQDFQLNGKLENKKWELVFSLKDNRKYITLTYGNDIYECILNHNIPISIAKYKKKFIFCKERVVDLNYAMISKDFLILIKKICNLDENYKKLLSFI